MEAELLNCYLPPLEISALEKRIVRTAEYDFRYVGFCVFPRFLYFRSPTHSESVSQYTETNATTINVKDFI